jgi:flagellar biosynthesis GTPase FlhF
MNVHGLRATGLRAGLIAVSLLLPLALGTPGAQAACGDPALEITPDGAKAGEKVAFTITDATPGGEYLLKVGDSELNAGTASDTTVSDSFKMPDLGAKSRQMNVQAVLAHDDCENSPWKLVQPIAYTVPAAKRKADQKEAIEKALGQSPGAKQIANLKEQRANERRNARKRERALKNAIKKRQAEQKRRVAAQKRKAKANQERQRRAQARKKKTLEEALRRRQRQQEARQPEAKKPQSPAAQDQARDRRGGGDSSKAFVALGLLYALIGGLGGGGFLLWRRSGRGVPMSRREADAAPPPVPEFGETTGAPPVQSGLLLESEKQELDASPASSAEELDAARKSPEPDDFDALTRAGGTLDGQGAGLEKDVSAHTPLEKPASEHLGATSDKEKLEAELRRILTDAGIDAELEGILADVQAEAERRGVRLNADLMMQLLCDDVDNSAKLSGSAEGELRSKLQEIVAEEKERVALQHPER